MDHITIHFDICCNVLKFGFLNLMILPYGVFLTKKKKTKKTTKTVLYNKMKFRIRWEEDEEEEEEENERKPSKIFY